MSGYHKYVFNTATFSFVGDFEEMYKQDALGDFDSWNQDSSGHLSRKLAFSLLPESKFRRIVDLGSGKGLVASQLSKYCDEILGFDISLTAVDIARSRYPNLVFEAFDLNNVAAFNAIWDLRRLSDTAMMPVLTTSFECLSYLENWRELVAALATRTHFLLITLYLPEKAIGFVKDQQVLEYEIGKNYNVLELIVCKKSRHIIVYAQSKYIA